MKKEMLKRAGKILLSIYLVMLGKIDSVYDHVARVEINKGDGELIYEDFPINDFPCRAKEGQAVYIFQLKGENKKKIVACPTEEQLNERS